MSTTETLPTSQSPQTRFVQSPLLQIYNFQSNKFSTTRKSPATFKTWPVPMIESRGDYREESHIEDLVGGPLYEAQKTLPKLPIPQIKDTISTFLPTALPLAESENEARTMMGACKNFPAQAENLHQRLIARREGEMENSSWLQLWWNTAGYLQVRDPLVVNVSYFFHFSDDESLPLQVQQQKNDTRSLGVMRAASILHSGAEFRKLVCTGSLPQQRIGRKEPRTPLCSVAFKYMFNSCRVPRREQDTYRMYDPSAHRHCVVARKGMYFAVDFIDDSGDPLPLDVIEDRLQQCVKMADEKEGQMTMFGWLTSSDRDSWADAREELLRVGGLNMQSALEKLESGALMICLDDEAPVTDQDCANLFWTGGLSSGHNRWFDKSIQIMCSNNGKAGLMGEHSMMDGMPMIAMADHVTKNTYADAQQKSSGNMYGGDGGVEDIFGDCLDSLMGADSQVSLMVGKAKNDFTTLITKHDLHVQKFKGYGSSHIKKMGYSPDAFAQMAIQLAVYRLHGKQVGTYEASQMRPFLHGRTETTRTLSLDSCAFVKCMGLKANFRDNVSSMEEKRSLLQKATKTHVEYIGKASKGKGVDRHFFGMSMLANDEDKMPALYSDPLFIRSKRWRVSTSHLTHPKFENWGFGEVVPDGVGVGYAVKSDSCVFNVTALKEHGWTKRLCDLLEEALLEMKAVNEVGLAPKSKL